jgi:Dolichyl-phosphate-mannose-protein mannosyltransferase
MEPTRADPTSAGPPGGEPPGREPRAREPRAREPLAPDPGGARPGRVRSRAWGRAGGAWGGWMLAAVLVVQAVLSLRLVRADTAFEDEAAYIWAGHLEWSHWLHGTPVPHFAAYFSGAPVLYPPVAALADHVGGLAGARILSLAFMLASTAVLWATASRLAGRRAAFFAAALFAVAGPTLHLGAFATFDALSVLLVSVAAWVVVRAGDRSDATVHMLIAGTVLALANAVAYSSALLDPIVILLALAVAARSPGGKAAVARTLTLAAVTAAWLTAGVLLSGSVYASGITRTTLERVGGADGAGAVLTSSLAWTGIIAAAAACGLVVAAARREYPRAWLLALLTAAAVIVPLEQARLHTADSLSKHVDGGIWFAAIAAGYAADVLIASSPTLRQRTVTAVALVVALAFPVTLGAAQSRSMATAWPSSGSFTAILRPLITGTSGRLLVEDPSIAEYYLSVGRNWTRWSSTRNIVLPSGRSTGGPTAAGGVTGAGNAGTFAEFITAGYFQLVALNFADTTALDKQLSTDLKRDPRYHIVDVIPYGTSGGTWVIWRYGPRR